MKMYIVDDDKDFVSMFMLSCEAHWDVSTFSNAKDALVSIMVDKPSVVVSDIMMPRFHGVEFGEVVKKIHPTCELVFISANSIEDIEKEFGTLPSGSKFFRKPLSEKFFDYLDYPDKTLSAENSDKNIASEMYKDLIKLREVVHKLEEYEIDIKRNLMTMTNHIHNAVTYGKRDEKGHAIMRIFPQNNHKVELLFDAHSNVALKSRSRTFSLPMPTADLTASFAMKNNHLENDTLCMDTIEEIYSCEDYSDINKKLRMLKKYSEKSGKSLDYYYAFLPRKVLERLDEHHEAIRTWELTHKFDRKVRALTEAAMDSDVDLDMIKNAAIKIFNSDSSDILNWINGLSNSEVKDYLMEWVNE